MKKWKNRKIETRIRETGYPGTIANQTKLHALALLMQRSVDPQSENGQLIQQAIDHDLENIDFLHRDAINCTLMSIGLELAELEGHKPDPHSTEDFIECLMRSTVPPAVVLQWVGIALGVTVPKEITAAVERLREREATPRKPHVRAATYRDWEDEQRFFEAESDPKWRAFKKEIVNWGREMYWRGVHDSKGIFDVG